MCAVALGVWLLLVELTWARGHVYVDCKNGVATPLCWTGGRDIPCRSLKLAMEGASLSGDSVSVLDPANCHKQGLDRTVRGGGGRELDSYHGTLCPPTSVHTENNTCECGDSVHGILTCTNGYSYAASCYCVTYTGNGTESSGEAVIGACLYTCDNVHRVNKPTDCGRWNREGELCGRCQPNHAPPIYSYSLECVQCPAQGKEKAKLWLQYIAMAYGPLTLFLVAVTCFRVNLVSPKLYSFTLVCQAMALPPQIRASYSYKEQNHVFIPKTAYNIVASFYGIWNLDFFRTLYPPFCVSESMGMLETVAMDYLIALYPLLFLVLMYLLVELYSRDVRVVVRCWRPFHHFLSRSRRHWDIQTTLVGAFASFFLLSYSKFGPVSMELLLPTYAWTMSNGTTLKREYHLLSNGSLKMLAPEHCPFAIIGLLVFLLVTVSPILLIALYPTAACQKCLRGLGRGQIPLKTFMDIFQGSFKDGTQETRDCRWFPAIYLLLRVVLMCIYFGAPTDFYYPIAILLLLAAVVLTLAIQPQKKRVHNSIDIFQLLALASWYLVQYTAMTVSLEWEKKFALAAYGVVTLVPVAYLMAIMMMCCYRHYCRQRDRAGHGRGIGLLPWANH